MSENAQNSQQKLVALPPRRVFSGWDYNKERELRMTGREWHEYAKREMFKTERGSDAVWGAGVEIHLDGKGVK